VSSTRRFRPTSAQVDARVEQLQNPRHPLGGHDELGDSWTTVDGDGDG
jgi:hypothetical protein